MTGVPFDVSDVLLDPDWSQEFSVSRATETVGSDGRTVSSNATFTASGVIHPATAEQLERVPEADRSSEIIAVLTPTRLTPGSDAYLPDVVTWKGKPYRVVNISDWSDFGAGFVEALAASVDMQGKEPTA